ncbi:MAG: ComF family protein [Clostridia bacterium]|nr:ComF family protein [Clostridia bacterium]
MKNLLYKLLIQAAGAIGDRCCPLCRSLLTDPEALLCPACYVRLAEEAAIPCGDCGHPASSCTCPDSSLSPLPAFLNGRNWLAHTWYFHAGEDRLTEMLLLSCKKKYSPALSAYIAGIMTDELAAILPEHIRTDWILTYAPRSVSGFTAHGFDQCEEIVRRIGKRLHIPVRKMLVRVGGGEQKTMESADRRMSNIAGAFEAVRVPESCRVLLFDDIITTGATMREAGQVLAEAGAVAVFPVAFAKTMYTRRKTNI